MNDKIKKDKHPLAINIKKLQRYNYNYFCCEEVILFEYLVVKGKSFKFKPFYHSSETIFKETGIKKHSLNTILKRFKELGYISIEVKGMPKVKHFTVHYPKIQEDLAKIYLLEENGKQLYEFRQLLTEYYLTLTENYQEKYIKKNSKSIINENYENLSENEISFFEDFIIFLNELKIKINLKANQVDFKDGDFYSASKQYDIEALKYYVTKYFEQNKNGKLSTFLKPISKHTLKLNFIEKEKLDEEKYLNAFIQSLENEYNNRIRMFNENKQNKRGKSRTALVFNNNIKEKIKEALFEKGELGTKHAFIAYTDAVLKGEITPSKFLPYFFSKQYGDFGVIDTYLDNFNINYGYDKN